jgi:hypothetical protein
MLRERSVQSKYSTDRRIYNKRRSQEEHCAPSLAHNYPGDRSDPEDKESSSCEGQVTEVFLVRDRSRAIPFLPAPDVTFHVEISRPDQKGGVSRRSAGSNHNTVGRRPEWFRWWRMFRRKS